MSVKDYWALATEYDAVTAYVAQNPGRTTAEIAAVMQIPHGIMQNRLYALQRLGRVTGTKGHSNGVRGRPGHQWRATKSEVTA